MAADMRFPLVLDYDHDPDTGSSSAILDADGRLIVEDPGPDATWRDLDTLVRYSNAHAERLAAAVEEG